MAIDVSEEIVAVVEWEHDLRDPVSWGTQSPCKSPFARYKNHGADLDPQYFAGQKTKTRIKRQSPHVTISEQKSRFPKKQQHIHPAAKVTSCARWMIGGVEGRMRRGIFLHYLMWVVSEVGVSQDLAVRILDRLVLIRS